MSKGEVLSILLRAHAAHSGIWRWTAEIPILVDGRRSIISVTPPAGGEFSVVGSGTEHDELIGWDATWLTRGEMDKLA